MGSNNPIPLPAPQPGDGTARRPRYDPKAIARKMNAIVEDLNEEGKLNDQQYVALQNCARDVFNFPIQNRDTSAALPGIGDSLRVILSQFSQDHEERERAEAIRLVATAERAQERAQWRARSEADRARVRREETIRAEAARDRARREQLQRDREQLQRDRERDIRLREAAERRQKADELRAQVEARQAAQRARDRRAQEDDLKEQGVWLQPPPPARKRARPVAVRRVIHDDDSDSGDDFAHFIANNMQQRAADAD